MHTLEYRGGPKRVQYYVRSVHLLCISNKTNKSHYVLLYTTRLDE